MKLAIIALAASAAALSAAAVSTTALAAKTSPLAIPGPPPGTGLPSGQCFRTRDIRNHTIADRDTLLVSVKDKDVYRIGVKGCLAGAVSSDPIITRNPPGSEIICRPIDMDLAIGHTGGGFATHCIVDSISKLSPEQVAALPRKLRP